MKMIKKKGKLSYRKMELEGNGEDLENEFAGLKIFLGFFLILFNFGERKKRGGKRKVSLL